ncbi:cobalamin synthesis protein CobW-like [Chloropicon roscoffensis]|uniref:Cobalamin synthesis protein CobW-like n=1 Tax=Chloropicon roscoffensis TaxID=1461544 RepID=A0AAX4PI78_9CHLO
MVVAEAPKSSSSAPPPCLPDDFVPVPVTLLSGFLGAGKTTLLRSMLHQAHEGENAKKVAVLVNDMAEINIDANLVKETKLLQSEEKLVELQNGCICCTLREDLVKALADLASEDKRIDAIVVESTGVSLPNEVADTFVADVPPPGDQPALGLPANVKNTKKNQELLKKVEDEQEEQRRALESITRALRGKRTLNEIARLDTCVTMVDCASFDANMATTNEMREQFADSVEKTDLRNVGPLLTSQIEFADVLILSKCDLVSAEKAGAVEDAVRALNPSAKVLRALKGDVNLSEVLCTSSFSMKRAANGAGWMKILDGDDVPETEEYGIHSFVYKARTPFHPMRLWAILSAIFYVKYENDSMEVKGEERDFQVRQAVRSARMKKAFGQILRSKGGLWLAGRDHLMCGWSQAGGVGDFSCGGFFTGFLPKKNWPQRGTREHGKLMELMEPIVQDRRQEIVIIGQGLKREAITAALDACLITKEDLKAKDADQHRKVDAVLQAVGALDLNKNTDGSTPSNSAEHAENLGKHAWKFGVDYLEDPWPKWPGAEFYRMQLGI